MVAAFLTRPRCPAAGSSLQTTGHTAQWGDGAVYGDTFPAPRLGPGIIYNLIIIYKLYYDTNTREISKLSMRRSMMKMILHLVYICAADSSWPHVSSRRPRPGGFFIFIKGGNVSRYHMTSRSYCKNFANETSVFIKALLSPLRARAMSRIAV